MAEAATIIINLVSSLGFPIVVTIVLFYFIWQLHNDNKEREDKLYEQIDQMQENQNEQIEKFGTSLDNFGKTLSSIDARLSILETTIISKPL